MPYLLSIELREADDNYTTTGGIVLLSQAWCSTADDALHEFDADYLTGERFRHALDALREGATDHSAKDIAADPRVK